MSPLYSHKTYTCNMAKTKREMKDKKQWHTLDYIDALRFGYEQYKAEEKELMRTTAMIPQTMRIEIEQIGARWNYSQRYSIFQLLYHGHAKLQHINHTLIKEVQQLKTEMKHPKIGRIRDFLYDMRTIVNGLSKPKQRTVLMSNSISASLGAMGESLGIERASLIRICMYYSIVTLEDASHEITTIAYQEIQKFQEYIVESKAIYAGFALSESMIEENNE